ncbi:hypothetical protein BDP27DRAFT_984713 [Rhodocollybia butyracea]|uniref:Vacuolar calcium ion transporter n=1 Tax=Rhodocollybia butyracea TaxID=206335 RepID=A0A9P5PNS9_9AGAR|nr:hypothetical protein BDP27DRAFT_984713 [Rhodocollybia butyracea]
MEPQDAAAESHDIEIPFILVSSPTTTWPSTGIQRSEPSIISIGARHDTEWKLYSADTYRDVMRRRDREQDCLTCTGNSSIQNSLSNRRSRSLQQAKTSLFRPKKPVGPSPTLLQSLRWIACASWFNLLLICIPISWALYFTMNNQNTAVFVFSFLAIIPLAKLLALATDELSMRVGQPLAVLLNASVGNIATLIITIIALIRCQLNLVQAGLFGSMYGTLFLSTGVCFFAGGLRFFEQPLGGRLAIQLNLSLLNFSALIVLLPNMFISFHMGSGTVKSKDFLKLSHGAAAIGIIVYISYLFFQLCSHSKLYADEDIQPSIEYSERNFVSDFIEVEEEEIEKPQMSVVLTFASLIILTALLAVTSNCLVDSMDGLTSKGKLSEGFVGIILPIVANAPVFATAAIDSARDKLIININQALHSCVQLMLCGFPSMILLGWILGKPLTFLFDMSATIVLFFVVLAFNSCMALGKSNWLQGIILIGLYLILGVILWFQTGTNPSWALDTCK